jgi:regulator of cell morphogenesis and NO signaling
MFDIDPSETVASITLRLPSAARTFERLGIDFCCRGGVPLAEACSPLNRELAAVVSEEEGAGFCVRSSAGLRR